MSKAAFSHKNLGQEVAEYLKTEILLENLKAGERILEAQVANTLNISRAPVREAMKELENNGLVTNIPRRGTFVINLSNEDIEEIFDIRVILEIRIFEELLRHKKLQEKDFQRLTLIVDEMVDIARRQDMEDLIIEVNKKDIAFHHFLWDKSGRKWSMKILQSLHNQIQLAMVIDSRREGDLVESAEKHYGIIRNLKQGDLKAAKLSLVEHILTYKESVKGEYMNFL